MMGHTWSLVIKDHFYLLLPILLSGPSRSNCKKEEPFAAIPRLFLAIGLPAWRYEISRYLEQRFALFLLRPCSWTDSSPTFVNDYECRRGIFRTSETPMAPVHAVPLCIAALFMPSGARLMQTIPPHWLMRFLSSSRCAVNGRRGGGISGSALVLPQLWGIFLLDACAIEFLMFWSFRTLAMAFWSLAPNRDGNGIEMPAGAFATNRSGTAQCWAGVILSQGKKRTRGFVQR
jgi:hypothetical protein